MRYTYGSHKHPYKYQEARGKDTECTGKRMGGGGLIPATIKAAEKTTVIPWIHFTEMGEKTKKGVPIVLRLSQSLTPLFSSATYF